MTDHAASEESIVSLRGVDKSFADRAALRGLSLTVRRGEILALLGPSGCGKSTALRILAGLIAPSAGAVVWSRGDWRGAGAVGFVFQEPTLMPWASVAANVHLPLKLAGLDAAAAQPRVADALSRVGLSDVAHAYPHELSGGMKMRVSIARALVTAPSLLLMDEPFAALDEITRFRLNNDLLALWQAAEQSIAFVTHSVFESVFLARRILVMTPRPGRVFAEIAVDEPYPRAESFRSSARYAALCGRVSHTLAQAMAEAPT